MKDEVLREGVFDIAYRLGYGDGLHDGLRDTRRTVMDSFWSGVAVGLSVIPIAAILVVAWKTFS